MLRQSTSSSGAELHEISSNIKSVHITIAARPAYTQAFGLIEKKRPTLTEPGGSWKSG